MTDDQLPQAVQEIFEDRRRRWEQLPRRERLRHLGRYRNRHRLIQKWRKALDEYDGPGRSVLVGDYHPSGIVGTDDVGEIAGLIVWDARGTAHHLRLYRDERVEFIESPEDPESPIGIDPMSTYPTDKVYLSSGVPEAVVETVDALEVAPTWREACNDGEHEFAVVEITDGWTVRHCERCEFNVDTLSWLGHAVPPGNALQRGENG